MVAICFEVEQGLRTIDASTKDRAFAAVSSPMKIKMLVLRSVCRTAVDFLAGHFRHRYLYQRDVGVTAMKGCDVLFVFAVTSVVLRVQPLCILMHLTNSFCLLMC